MIYLSEIFDFNLGRKITSDFRLTNSLTFRVTSTLARSFFLFSILFFIASTTTSEARNASIAEDILTLMQEQCDDTNLIGPESTFEEILLATDGTRVELFDQRNFDCPSDPGIFRTTGGGEIVLRAPGVERSFTARGWELAEIYGLPVLLLSRHGSYCGAAGYVGCIEAVTYIDGQFHSVGYLDTDDDIVPPAEERVNFDTLAIEQLYQVRAAEALALAGETEHALSQMLSATEALLGNLEIPDAVADDVLISFDRVLEQAYRRRSVSLGANEVVAIAPGQDIYVSSHISGLQRIDRFGERHPVAYTQGAMEYAIKIIPDAVGGSSLVLWQTHEGLRIDSGLCLDCSADENSDIHRSRRNVAFVPNLGEHNTYQNWRTEILEDDRLLIGQWSGPQARWDEGLDSGAHVFDPSSGELAQIAVPEGATFQQLVDQQEGRNPWPEIDASREVGITWGCAGDAPGTLRYRLSEIVIPDVNSRTERDYTFVDCKWTGNVVALVAVNLASSIYRSAHFYALDIPDDPAEQEGDLVPFVNHLGSVNLAIGEHDRYNHWDHISVARDDDGSPTIVTHADQEVTIIHRFEAQSFQMPDPVRRVVALGPGRAAVLLSPDMPAWAGRLGGGRIVQIDANSNWSEFLETIAESQPASLPPRSPASIQSPVCLEDSMLDRNEDGERVWFHPESQIPSVIPDMILRSVTPLCIYPTAIGGYYVVDGKALVTVADNGAILNSVTITPSATSGALRTPIRNNTSFWATSRSILRIDWLDSGVRAQEELRVWDKIIEASISPSGNRVVIATTDGSPTVNLSIWSIAAGRLWRSIGAVHRWHEVDFPQDEIALAGDASAPTSHRLLTLAEARFLAGYFLNGRMR